MQDQRRAAEFVKLLTSHQRRLFLQILTFLPNPLDAEEALQETNVVLWSKAAEFIPDSSFSAWAQKVAYFKVLAFRKRGMRDRLTFTPELLEIFSREATSDDAADDRRRLALVACLEKLSERDRGLIMRRYAAGVTVHSVADEVNRPASSIYRSLERIRLALLTCIQRAVAAEGRSS